MTLAEGLLIILLAPFVPLLALSILDEWRRRARVLGEKGK